MQQTSPTQTLAATRVDHDARADRFAERARADRAAYPRLTGAARAAAWRMLARTNRQH